MEWKQEFSSSFRFGQRCVDEWKRFLFNFYLKYFHLKYLLSAVIFTRTKETIWYVYQQ